MKTKINCPHLSHMLKPTCTCINHQIKWKHSTCFPQVQHWSIFRHRFSCYWQFCTSCPPHSSRPARIIFFGTAGHICNETWGSYSLVNMMALKIWQYQTNIIIIGIYTIAYYTRLILLYQSTIAQVCQIPHSITRVGNLMGIKYSFWTNNLAVGVCKHVYIA